MKLSNIAKVMCFLTIAALIYIHMEMKIIDLAYKGKMKETQIRDLMEQNGNATYNVLSLKSASYLGGKLLVEESDMQFADPQDIFNLSLPRQLFSKIEEENESPDKSNPLLSLLSFRSR